MKIGIQIYKTKTGKAPFLLWLNDLDRQERSIIRARLERVAEGNLGNCKPLKGSLWEIIIDHGPRYRIYFGKINDQIILLLNAGDKGNQSKDIESKRILA